MRVIILTEKRKEWPTTGGQQLGAFKWGKTDLQPEFRGSPIQPKFKKKTR